MDIIQKNIYFLLICALTRFTSFSFVHGSISMLTSSCCSLATGSCRSSCEEISLVSLAVNDDDRWRHLNKLSTFCPPQLISFWTCLNDTLQEVDKGHGFFGRPCCSMPLSQACALVCLQAKSKEDLIQACRPSDEITFYACLDHQKAGQQCCEEAKNSECNSACRELFSSTAAPSKQMRNYVTNACSHDNSHVLQCVRNFTHTTPAENPSKSIHCCDKSPDSECRIACRNILKTQTIGQEIVDNLIAAGCGLPMPHDKLWQCFLANADSKQTDPKSISHLDGLGMDSAKLQCCFRAASLTCQRLCIKTYSNEWEKSWEEFDQQCQYQPAESAMLQCLAEVEEPCELGCEGLNYCSNFNHRPVELFRNCNAQSDRAARNDVELWRQGIIRMPMVDIPVLDISTCHPDTWKTIACALQIKPCHKKAHVNMICKSDCLNLLSQCVDSGRLQEGQSAASLCEILSPGKDQPCISLNSYLNEVKPVEPIADVTHPCKSNICSKNEICLVNRSCHLGDPCFAHSCVTGCRLGPMSHLVIPGNTYALVPRIFHGKYCHRACYCSKHGSLEKCAAMPCLTKGRCLVQGTEIAHMSKYYGNCSICFCYAGELRCAQMCKESNFYNSPIFAGLPCNCPPDYIPVCGANGKTYPSACVARCAGLKDGQITAGTCSQNDPCDSNNCGTKKKCLQKRQVCLSLKRKCPQYICVPINNSCLSHSSMPICDTDHNDHPDPCSLLQKEKQLSYYGKCLLRCQRRGQVCGHNGQTYPSECAAMADYMIIDYRQPCIHPSPSFARTPAENQCSRVQCAPLPSSHCSEITPPGSCCPICGAILKLVYSQTLLDRAIDAIQDNRPSLILTLREKLEQHVKTAECSLSAYLSIDSTVVVIIRPSSSHPSELQVKACLREAENLQSLVEQMSPTLLTELPLSTLIGGFIITPTTDVASSVVLRTPPGILIMVLSLLLIFL